jgi:hypothetical protein
VPLPEPTGSTEKGGDDVELTFEPSKQTKGTQVFSEVLASDLDEASIPSLYIRKGALGPLGFTGTEYLRVTIEVVK